ncbi:MAG: rRNA synthase [Chloroflexota bacterium]|jgi:23S rRNA pseudouridine1911/1915/1917 synthase|nr:rRNA synthase [Chloroflexota bacterium]
MSATTELVVEHDEDRLDRFLAESGVLPSRAVATRLVRQGAVLVNGEPARASRSVVAGDRVSVAVPDALPAHYAAEDIALAVVFEDADLMVVDKPAGMVVHPGAGRRTGTLVNALLGRHSGWPSLGGPERPGIVHRLDKGTSGLMLVARTDVALRRLSADLAHRRVRREYLAIATGTLKDTGMVEAPIGRNPRDRKRMAVVEGGRPAVTHFTALEAVGRHTLLVVRLETGRTHQVRVHLAAIGHPLLGDSTYGHPAFGIIDRPALHSQHIEFDHPVSGERMAFTAPLPADIEAALARLREAP